MSSGADCRFTEVEPGKWTYELQRYPYGANEDYDTFGPFTGYQRAHKHLEDNHQNPGGSMTRCLPEGQHVHEWVKGGWVPVGFIVHVRVDSLGGAASKEEVIGMVKSLPVDHTAWEVRTRDGYSETVTRCASCGAKGA